MDMQTVLALQETGRYLIAAGGAMLVAFPFIVLINRAERALSARIWKDRT